MTPLIDVEAAKSVLIELTHILGEYRDDMVLVGGWILELLIPQSQERHVGSIDVDLALNHKELTEAGYRKEKVSVLTINSTALRDRLGPWRGRFESICPNWHRKDFWRLVGLASYFVAE